MSIDELLFRGLNGPDLPPVLEQVLAVPNEASTYLPLLGVLACVGLVRSGPRTRVTLALALLAVAITDPVGHRLIQNLVALPRPCQSWNEVVLRADRCPASYSFPSLHAANVAAAATVFGLRHPRSRLWMLALPLIAGLARLRAGVHTPADLLGGLGLGFTIGAAVTRARTPRRLAARGVALLRPLAQHWWVALALAAACTAAIAPAGVGLGGRSDRELVALANLDAADDPSERLEAAIWLRRHKHEIRSPDATATLLGALADPQPVVRFHAATTLGHIDPREPAVSAAFVRALEDPIVGVRYQAAWGLGMAGAEAEEALAPLSRLMTTDPSPGVRRAARAAVGRIRGEH